MRRSLEFVLLVSLVASSCSSGERGTTECDNGITVFDDVACAEVVLDMDNLPNEMMAAIIVLEDEATEDPSKALANAQRIQRLLAQLPSEVCSVMQSDPDSQFLQTENIAPIVADLSETTCPFSTG